MEQTKDPDRDRDNDHDAARQTPAERWLRIALWLVGGTMAYNAVEAGLAVWAGLKAGSIALVGFGLDSIIELAAAAVLLWRLNVEASGRDRAAVETSERRVHLFVGITFILLSLYVVVVAGRTLWTRDVVQESTLGIVLAAASLLIMPVLSWGKLRAARELGSAALRAEAKETLACSYLSFTLLLGLVANAVAGWWWADPVAALLMVPWLIREGIEGIRGEEDEDEDHGSDQK
jgi:divalent metal cation (Fe/Co/Zn/Cd) transporter